MWKLISSGVVGGVVGAIVTARLMWPPADPEAAVAATQTVSTASPAVSHSVVPPQKKEGTRLFPRLDVPSHIMSAWEEALQNAEMPSAFTLDMTGAYREPKLNLYAIGVLAEEYSLQAEQEGREEHIEYWDERVACVIAYLTMIDDYSVTGGTFDQDRLDYFYERAIGKESAGD